MPRRPQPRGRGQGRKPLSLLVAPQRGCGVYRGGSTARGGSGGGPPGPARSLRLQFAIRAGRGPQALQSKRPTLRKTVGFPSRRPRLTMSGVAGRLPLWVARQPRAAASRSGSRIFRSARANRQGAGWRCYTGGSQRSFGVSRRTSPGRVRAHHLRQDRGAPDKPQQARRAPRDTAGLALSRQRGAPPMQATPASNRQGRDRSR